MTQVGKPWPEVKAYRELRDRIAAAIMREQVWNEKNHLSFADGAQFLADAVIRELDLRPERGWGNGSRQTTRYVTDWKADDE